MATGICNKANEEYVEENYQKAVDLYTEALALEDTRDDIYCFRAQAHLSLGNITGAINDCDEAIRLNRKNQKAYIKKGSILLKMDDVLHAQNVFKEGQEHCGDKTFEDWLGKVESRMKELEIGQPTQQTQAPNLKHNWYQTHTHVIVTVLIKNVKKEELTLDVEDRLLKIAIKMGDTSNDLKFILAHPIVPEQTQSKLFSTKIEIKLKKSEGIQWIKLEGTLDEVESSILPPCAAPADTDLPRYPSSSHYTRDWDKLAAEVTEEEKSEKLEGDAALNQFFQKIYADASDDTKKAMMKSFSESGGTVLSTNWSEVGSKKVDVKPPDGMEYKQWEN